jgi:hypothetical protein
MSTPYSVDDGGRILTGRGPTTPISQSAAAGPQGQQQVGQPARQPGPPITGAQLEAEMARIRLRGPQVDRGATYGSGPGEVQQGGPNKPSQQRAPFVWKRGK